MFWDTSCILKLYATESDSETWAEEAAAHAGEIAISALAETEMSIALLHKELRGELIHGAALQLSALFMHDVTAGRFRSFPVGSDVLRQAGSIAKICLLNRPSVPLRTLDAIHLATAQLCKARRIVTADDHMRRAARVLGLEV